MHAILKGDRPDLPEPGTILPGPDALPCLPAYIALMQACWAGNAAARPAFDEIIPALRQMLASVGVNAA